MTMEFWQSFLGWNALVHLGILIFWVVVLKLAPDFVYKAHNYWVPISKESFNSIHYGGMGIYKLFIFFFLLVPYFVLLGIR